jgi:hypothetical protein
MNTGVQAAFNLGENSRWLAIPAIRPDRYGGFRHDGSDFQGLVQSFEVLTG